MRKRNLLFLLGLSFALSGCSVHGQERIAQTTVGETVGVVEDILSSEDSSVEDIGETVGEEIEDSSDKEGIINSDSHSTSFPLEFNDEYKSLINNSAGNLLFVNESEFSDELSKLFTAYTNTSSKKGVVSIVEDEALIETFYFAPSNFISVIIDDSVLKSSYNVDESSWICESGLSGFDSIEELEYSMQYDTGFDFLLSTDRCIFKLTNIDLLDSGDTVYTCEYLYIGGESGVMNFTVSSDDCIKYISKDFKNRSKLYVIDFEDSVDEFNSSLSNLVDMLSTVDNPLTEEVYNDIINK